jgi:hypothetical protein
VQVCEAHKEFGVGGMEKSITPTHNRLRERYDADAVIRDELLANAGAG